MMGGYIMQNRKVKKANTVFVKKLIIIGYLVVTSFIIWGANEVERQAYSLKSFSVGMMVLLLGYIAAGYFFKMLSLPANEGNNYKWEELGGNIIIILAVMVEVPLIILLVAETTDIFRWPYWLYHSSALVILGVGTLLLLTQLIDLHVKIDAIQYDDKYHRE